MGACASRGPLENPKPSARGSSSFTSQKELRFSYENRVVSTTVKKSTSLEDLNSFLLSAFGLDESLHAVTGVLVTVTGPLIPFFMSSYLHANPDSPPYAIVVAPRKSLAITNWGRAPDAAEQADATLEWSELESDSAAASRFLAVLHRYGYVRLHLPDASPLPKLFQSATTSAQRFFTNPEDEKRKKFLGFHQQKFVGFSHAVGSARQFLQLRTTRGKVTHTGKHVPLFDSSLIEAYLALQNVSYQLFKLLCHPDLSHLTHLSPEIFSTLVDPPCESVASFNDCKSVPESQFVGTNVFRVYQYLRDADAPTPGLMGAATTVHTDMGLLTVSPQANLPGLTVLKHSDGSSWVNVEMKADVKSDVQMKTDSRSDVKKTGARNHVQMKTDLRSDLEDLRTDLEMNSDLRSDFEDSRAALEDLEDSRTEFSGNYVFVFAGETMAQLTKGYLRAPLHFVDERTPAVARFSMPFFLRARQKAVLPAVEGFYGEMTVEHFMRKVLHEWKQVWGHKPTTDF